MTSISPTIGSTAGGTTVNIIGSGFGMDPTVTIGGIICAWKVSDIGQYRNKNLCEWGESLPGGVNCSGIGASDTHIQCIANPANTAIDNAEIEITVEGKGLGIDRRSVITPAAASLRCHLSGPPLSPRGARGAARATARGAKLLKRRRAHGAAHYEYTNRTLTFIIIVLA